RVRTARRPGLPITSPTNRIFTARSSSCRLIPCPSPALPTGRERGAGWISTALGSSRVFDRAGLADDRDLDLARVGQLGLDLARDVLGEPERLVVRELAAVDDDAHLAAGLDRERLLHPLEGGGDLLELLEPLHVGLEDLAAGAGPGGGEGVGRGHQHGLDGLRIVVAVMASHAVDDLLGLAVLAQQVDAELEMGAVHLAVDRLADVVEDAGPAGDLDVRLELGRHGAGQERHLAAVVEDVLAVRRPIAEASEQLDQLGVEIRDAELEDRRLALLEGLLLELRLDLLDHLFDARRMDPAVDDQAFERDPGDLAAERIEAREDDRLGRVVDDQVDAGRRLESADVAPLAADDPALHLVVRQHHDRDGRLRDVVGGRALDRHADDPLRLPVRRLVRLVLEPLDDVRGFHPGLVLERAHQLLARLLRGQARQMLELAALLFAHPGDLGLLDFEGLLAPDQGALGLEHLLLTLADLVAPLVEAVFLLGQPALDGLELGPALPRNGFELAPGQEQLLLRLQLRLADLVLALALGVGQDLNAALLGVGAETSGFAPPPTEQEIGNRDRDQVEGRDENQQVCAQLDTPSRHGGVGGEAPESEVR